MIGEDSWNSRGCHENLDKLGEGVISLIEAIEFTSCKIGSSNVELSAWEADSVFSKDGSLRGSVEKTFLEEETLDETKGVELVDTGSINAQPEIDHSISHFFFISDGILTDTESVDTSDRNTFKSYENVSPNQEEIWYLEICSISNYEGVCFLFRILYLKQHHKQPTQRGGLKQVP